MPNDPATQHGYDSAQDESGNRETNEVLAALADVANAVRAVTSYRPPEKSLFVLSTLPQSTHVRMRIYDFVFSVDAAAEVDLHIGGTTYTYNVPGADTRVITLPTLVDRGVDIFIATVDVELFAYLTYTPE